MTIWIIAAIAAFYIKGLCGFANTLVFDSILSFSANNISISPVELLTGYPSNGIMAFRERKHINVKLCLKTIVLLIIGSIPGTLFLALFLIPAMLLGLFLGMKSADFLDEKVAKKIVIVMLIISGVALILNNVI